MLGYKPHVLLAFTSKQENDSNDDRNSSIYWTTDKVITTKSRKAMQMPLIARMIDALKKLTAVYCMTRDGHS